MNRPRSIRARLITLYIATLSLIFVCFAGYTYWGFRQYLVRSLREGFVRRAHQIASTILAEIPMRGEAFIGDEIRLRYAPELNDRVIHVTDANGRIIYASDQGKILGQSPAPHFTDRDAETKPVHWEETTKSRARLQAIALGYQLPNGSRYVVEVAGSENDVASALNGLLLTLALGFPVFIGLTSVGAYILLGRALRPVDEIVRSAERITLRNLSQRLPVAGTGDEVERLSLALNRMIRRLDESYQITSRFTADASHELRTPLTIMRGELEALIKDERLSDAQAAQVESILEEAERLTHIVEGLLTISRLDAGESQLNTNPVDFSILVSSTVDQMELLAHEKSLSLICDAPPGVMVDANEVRLRQVVVNLLDNAIKYTPEGGKISVMVRASLDEAIMEIADDGIGISVEALPHVFERFYRSEQVQTHRVRGTGLGLSMVHSILEAHRGGVTVESRENVGSTFRVQLPRLDLSIARRMLQPSKLD